MAGVVDGLPLLLLLAWSCCGGIGGGTGYVGGGGNMTSYLYKVFACGKGPGSSNAYTRTLIEAIVGINK